MTLSKKQSTGLYIQGFMIFIGLLFSLYSLYYVLFVSGYPLAAIPILIFLLNYGVLIYSSLVDLKSQKKYYKIIMYLYIITIILSIIPVAIFVNYIAGLIELILLISLIYFVKNLDNTVIAKKTINFCVILQIILTILMFFAGDVKGVINYNLTAIASLIMIGTFSLIYHLSISQS